MRVLLLYHPASLDGIEPMGLMYLSAALKTNGHQTEICKAFSREIKRSLSQFKPQIIGFTLMTGFHLKVLELNKRIKKDYKCLSVLGGPHPTFFPEIINEEGVDAVCIGEGELSMVELADRLESGVDITDIANFWLKKDGKIFKNEVRPLIKDLDSIPFPDRELYNKYSFRRSYKSKSFLSSRGCPYKCTYCFNHIYNKIYSNKGKVVRLRNIDNIIEEIKEVKDRYPLECVWFIDDVFISTEDRLREFSEKYREVIGLPYICLARVESITREVCKLLKASNCYMVSMGIETGNDYLRREVLQRKMSKERITNAFQMVREEGIKTLAQNLFGIPGETLAEAFETIQLNILSQPTIPHINIFTPYPKLTLTEKAKELGIFPGDFDQIVGEISTSKSVLKLKDKYQLENLHKFFAIVVKFPFLLPLIKILIKIPANFFYRFIRDIWQGYSWREHCYPFRMSFYENLKLGWGLLLRYIG